MNFSGTKESGLLGKLNMPAVFICVSERKGLQLEAKEEISDTSSPPWKDSAL